MAKLWRVTFKSIQSGQILTSSAIGDTEKEAKKAFRKDWRRKWYQFLSITEIPDPNEGLTFEQRFAAMIARGKTDFPELFVGK